MRSVPFADVQTFCTVQLLCCSFCSAHSQGNDFRSSALPSSASEAAFSLASSFPPVCLFCCKEIGLLTFLSQKHLFCTAWRHTCFSLASCQAAVLLFFAFTFTFNVLNRATPEKARNEYLEAHHIPLFRGIKLTAEGKSYYGSLATELSAYANPQRQLLSMSFPADNAIPGMAPFLQWQGGGAH